MHRSFCGWTVLFGLGLAALAGFGVWRIWSGYLSGTPEPVEVRLADVTTEAPDAGKSDDRQLMASANWHFFHRKGKELS